MLSIDSNPVKELKEYHRNDNEDEDDDDTLNTIEQINLTIQDEIMYTALLHE